MKIKLLSSQLKEALEEQPELNTDCVLSTATDVMTAYQNANKWLDSTKEAVYIHMNCPFFSSYIHNLAHTMPVRFDAFGDILHTINMEIPYPATAELEKKPQNISEAFDVIFMVLDAIKDSLNAFIKCTDENQHGMACSAEACLNDIEKEYPFLFRLLAKWNQSNNDMVAFDKYVMNYIEHKDELAESAAIRAKKCGFIKE